MTKENRVVIILICVVSLSIFVGYFFIKKPIDTCKTHKATYAVEQNKIEDRNYTLLIADTPEKQSYGLMNITKKSQICNADGMIFKFPEKAVLTFWNMNTLVDLDVYWLSGERVESKSFLPKISTGKEPTYISSEKPVNVVIELVR